MESYNKLFILQTTITLTRFMIPASQAFLMDFVDKIKRGIANGIFSLGKRFGGTVVGSSMLGFIYEQYGQASLSM